MNTNNSSTYSNSTYGFRKLYFVEVVKDGLRKIFFEPALTLIQAQKKFEKKNKHSINRMKCRWDILKGHLNPAPVGYDESLLIDTYREEQLELKVERILTLWMEERRSISAASPSIATITQPEPVSQPQVEVEVYADMEGLMFI